MKKLTILLTGILACGLRASPASAQFTPQATAIPGSAPEGIGYQGRLEDSGFPVNATKQMVFRVYSAVSGGVLLWTSPAQNVSVALGLFNATVPVPVTTLVGGGARYLEVQIDGTIMSPRELLNSVPYALIAKSVEGTIDVSTAGLAINANSTASQPALYISSQTGNVGVGTSSPATAFDVGGSAQFGSGTTKSTFTAGGSLALASSATINGGYGGVPSGVTANSLVLGSGGVFPDAATAAFGDGSGWKYHIGTKSAGVFSPLLSVLDTGNIGVGAVNPGTKFHVSSGVVTVDGAGAGLTVGVSQFVATGGSVGVGTASPGSKLHLSTGTFIIDGNVATALTTVGSVGVGTPSPGTKLHVSSGVVTVDGAGAGLTVGVSQFVATGGSVGVGTASPGSKLHLSTGTLIIDGNVATALTTVGSVGVGTASPGSKLHLSTGTLIIDGNVATALTTVGSVGVGTPLPGSKLHLSSGTLIIDGTAVTALTTIGRVGVGTPLPGSKLHLSSGTLIIDGNVATALTTVGNIGAGTGGATPADRLEVAGGNVRLTAVAGSAGSVKLFPILTVGAVTCTTQCGANTTCLAAWTSAGAASTCGTVAANNRCLCSGFGD